MRRGWTGLFILWVRGAEIGGHLAFDSGACAANLVGWRVVSGGSRLACCRLRHRDLGQLHRAVQVLDAPSNRLEIDDPASVA